MALFLPYLPSVSPTASCLIWQLVWPLLVLGAQESDLEGSFSWCDLELQHNLLWWSVKSALEGRLVSGWVACYTLIISHPCPFHDQPTVGHIASSHFVDEAAEVQGLEVAGLPVKTSLIFIFFSWRGQIWRTYTNAVEV